MPSAAGNQTGGGGPGAPGQITSGPPYPPSGAALGGRPTTSVDIPISAVLLAFFVAGAAFNMTIFQRNRRRRHKFLPSVLLFGFCMARVAALSMRMAWASHPTNVDVAIAASVFTSAGVLILFLVNLLLSSRLLRAYRPGFGWQPTVRWAFRFLYASVVALLVMVVTASVYSFFTLDPTARRRCRDVQRVAATYLAVLAFLPVPVVLGATLWPRHPSSSSSSHSIEKFGHGSLRTKTVLVLATSLLLTLGAGFRVGVAFDVRPASNPAWFHHRAAYYCFNFVIELMVVYAYALSRFDRRFHVPDGSSAPGHYSGADGGTDSSRMSGRTVTEGDAAGPEDQTVKDGNNSAEEWDNRARTDLEK